MSFAYEANLVCQAFVADTDLSLDQYKAVKMLTTEKIALASDDGDFLFGVLQDAPTAQGQTCLVAMEGITKAVGGAAINAGVKVEITTGGKFVTYSNGPLAGIAVNACGGINQLFSLKICRDV